MEYKIDSITIKNFKFFYGNEESEESNKLVLGRKNLLLYGENGSGKSSIYWALYTMLQSSIKADDNEVIKYFEPNNPENLRNRFADDAEMSGISVCFSDDRNRQQVREISNINVNTVGEPFTIKTLLSSDFINYKYLAKIYDFRNSQNGDLFPLFERDLFQQIDLGEEYKDEKEVQHRDKTLASDWWDRILATPDELPYNKKVVSVSSEEYKRFKNIILPRFCELLKRYLNTITEKANIYLEEDFHCPFRLKFDFRKLVCDYNKSIGARAKDSKLHNPQILFDLIYIHGLLDETRSKVTKPHTFLNEAKLTAVALSIRLAMLDEKLKNSGGGKMLVLDDLLVSLDMSNRDVVLDIILKKAADFQLLILTHDRAFYNIAKLRIANTNSDSWVFKELYHKLCSDTDIPTPVIINPSSYLSCAQKYLKLFDYPASANYLRKECERVLCYLLPQNETIYISDTEGSKPATLEQLIKSFEKFCKQIGLDYSPYKKLIEYKNTLLNPLSHDNIESPIYRQELQSILGILERLNKLEKILIASVDNDDYLNIKIEDSEHVNWLYKLLLKENYICIKDTSEIIFYFNNPLILFQWRQNSDIGELLNHTKELQKGYNNICHRLKINDVKPELKDILYLSSGRSVVDLLR